mmetsp:Transcript_2290/g.4432  ORF Transcript_2290/g.4432 Transcript_2290/m.4432 type:complete len:742 (-) Transcript_2290:2800-5025(-)
MLGIARGLRGPCCKHYLASQNGALVAAPWSRLFATKKNTSSKRANQTSAKGRKRGGGTGQSEENPRTKIASNRARNGASEKKTQVETVSGSVQDGKPVDGLSNPNQFTQVSGTSVSRLSNLVSQTKAQAVARRDRRTRRRLLEQTSLHYGNRIKAPTSEDLPVSRIEKKCKDVKTHLTRRFYAHAVKSFDELVEYCSNESNLSVREAVEVLKLLEDIGHLRVESQGVTNGEESPTNLAVHALNVSELNVDDIFKAFVRSGEFLYVDDLIAVLNSPGLADRFPLSHITPLWLNELYKVGTCEPYPRSVPGRSANILEAVVRNKSLLYTIGGIDKQVDNLARLYIFHFRKYLDTECLNKVLGWYNVLWQMTVPKRYGIALYMETLAHLAMKEELLEVINLCLEAPPSNKIVETIGASLCICGEGELAELALQNQFEQRAWNPDSLKSGWALSVDFTSPKKKGKSANSRSNTAQKGVSLLKEKLVRSTVQQSWPLPRTVSCNDLMKFYSGQQDIDKVNRIFEQMKSHDIQLDNATKSIVATAFKGSEYAQELFRYTDPDLVPEEDHYIRGRDLLKHGVFNLTYSNKLDLHGLTRHQAKLAVVAHIKAIGNAAVELRRLEAQASSTGRTLFRVAESMETPFIIVTGKGEMGPNKMDRKGPILKRFVEQLLHEMQIPYYYEPNNLGRVYINLSALREYCAVKYALETARENTDKSSKRNTLLAFSGGSLLFLLPFTLNLLSGRGFF